MTKASHRSKPSINGVGKSIAHGRSREDRGQVLRAKAYNVAPLNWTIRDIIQEYLVTEQN